MLNFIFSFSHLDKKKITAFKNYLYLHTDHSLSFLTRSNFNIFFNSKHIELKKILTGKYLLIQVKNDSDISEIEILNNKLNFLFSLIKENDLNLLFFCAVGDSRYYFENFIIKSKKFDNKYLLSLIIKKNQLHFSYLFLLELQMYYLHLFRINNLRTIYNMDNFEYSYYY
jgi:hypothetical protein